MMGNDQGPPSAGAPCSRQKNILKIAVTVKIRTSEYQTVFYCYTPDLGFIISYVAIHNCFVVWAS